MVLLLIPGRHRIYAAEKTPVILVPGLASTINFEEFYGSGKDKWQWMPGAEDLYKGFITRLGSAGIEGYTEENCYLDIIYYDWRKPVSISAQVLKNSISQVKNCTGKEKVNVIAHSMGGLVARAYVEGSDYQNDVKSLVTLGSPHFGTPIAYFPWEGGEAYGWGVLDRTAVGLTIKLWEKRRDYADGAQVAQNEMPGL